jgi:spore coat polysaccharide biosynthesis protein SpsF
MNLAVIQARMGSSRLPGKILKPIGSLTSIELVVSRVRSARSVDKVVVATSTEASDDPLVNFCEERNFEVFRGSEQDVYTRFAGVANKYLPTNLLRITADCPFSDPGLIDELWVIFKEKNLDYASVATGAGFARSIEKRFPDGFDAEWVKASVLHDISSLIQLERDREHVTSFIWSHPDQFKLGHLFSKLDYSDIRVTLDTELDLVFIRKIAEILGDNVTSASFNDVIDVVLKKLELEQSMLTPEPYNEFYGQ